MQATAPSHVAARLLGSVLPAVRVRRQTPSAVQLMRNAGLPPDPWQMEVLTTTNTRLLLNCCRQSGKSTTLGALGLHTALSRPGALVLCVAPAQRQAQELYRKMVELYDHTPGLPAIAKFSELRLEFSTRSRILIVPADERRGVRGFSRPDLVIFDEASGIADDVFSAAQPLFATHARGKFVISSTPRGQRGFFHAVYSGDAAHWLRLKVTADQVPRITPAFLAQERAALGQMFFRQEYFAEFLQPDNAIFDYAALDAAADAGITPLLQSPYFGHASVSREAATPAAQAQEPHAYTFYR